VYVFFLFILSTFWIFTNFQNIVTLTRMTVILCTLYKDKDKSDSWCENITVGNTSIKFQLDTGAKCSILNRSNFRSIKTHQPLHVSTSPFYLCLYIVYQKRAAMECNTTF
jgi:hypothetical protein